MSRYKSLFIDIYGDARETNYIEAEAREELQREYQQRLEEHERQQREEEYQELFNDVEFMALS